MFNSSVFSAIAGAAACCLGAAALAQQPAQMQPTPILEIFACNYNANNDRADLNAAVARWTAWADRNNVRDYTAFIGTPYLFSTDQTFDAIWIGGWQNATAMGAGESLYFRTGREVDAGFAAVVDCSSHSQWAEVVVNAPQTPPPENGIAVFNDCELRGDHTVPETLAALGQVGEYFKGRGGPDAFVAALFPIAGLADDEDYDFKLIRGFNSIEDYGKGLDLYTGGGFLRVGELTGRLMECDSPRVYAIERVRLAAGNGAPSGR
jgi:hypothetical protein